MGDPIHCNVMFVYLLWVTARLSEWFLYACESTYNEEKALVGLLRDCENFADGSLRALVGDPTARMWGKKLDHSIESDGENNYFSEVVSFHVLAWACFSL